MEKVKNIIMEIQYLKANINGKRSGGCKEYDFLTGKLIFQGEYLNGIKFIGTCFNHNGKKIFVINKRKGKEYYHNGKLKFEGEYIDGQRFNGKFYDINCNVEHELKYGKGKGNEYNHDGKLIFEGDYLYG